MNQRLQQFILAENLSQAQFADTIGVARASVSHILAGRNKPGFDFIESMTQHFPNLNIEWLITGKGKMYKSSSVHSLQPNDFPSSKKETEASLFDSFFSSEEVSQDDIPNKRESSVIPKKEAFTPVDMKETIKSVTPPSPQSGKAHYKDISRIIIFYTDNTFRELK